ncbi:ABC-type bacteriocin/lantibiotic exporter with double-glycine peptidase domain [Christiangramia gaetbulicola]|uniref:ABC-type bacteriocin/lantibiotic exporter with double-glycine peptidase domain n=1 Tax=Christiangramia gaetbulicola TaxID=703340 RepID=A0A2T6AGR6_9FLAO|nr:ATP-binding cassette domain-containing protein [Christiangramia gaetbulicola]PTX43004.1 ABC-type bacteriocin/lantibiotic exporter with double-glycine peptidase domain [Christiangramia gaetbulicola]
MKENTLSPWRRFVGLLKLEKKDFLQIFYYAIFSGLVSLSVPLGIQAIVNLMQGARISTSWIVLVVLVTLGVAFVGILQLMQIRILENIQQKIFTRASFEFIYRFPKIKMDELKNFYPPELANRFFDVLTIQKGLTKVMLDFPAALTQVVLGIILLSLYHPFFILYGLLLVLLIYIVFKITAKKGLDTSIIESKHKYKIAHWIQEVARTLVSFKVSGRTNHAITKNDRMVSDYLDARESHFQILKLQFIQMIGFKVLVTAGLLLIGGILVLNQQMNIGQFVAAEIIILLIIGSVEKMILGLESFYDVLTSLEKLGQVVDKQLEDQDGEQPFSNNEPLHIELDNIVYNGFNGKEIINGIDLKISPGDKILLRGKNGAGKSTLLRLIAGLIRPTSGEIFINDISLKSLKLNHYRALLGQSLSEESPFEGTLLDNLTFGDKSISQQDIRWALEKTGLSDFVKQQPKGLNTVIHPEGLQIPYSVSRKILLARSIVRKPSLLILNDPLDQLDPEEEDKILDFLFSPENPWSIIVSSKEKKWEKYCDRILHIEQGKLVNNGK